MNINLTDEQIAIIEHPLNHHGRVLAVAGSGKTSTMVKRVRYLIEKHSIPPSSIEVLMFNRLAKKQFEDRIQVEGVPHGDAVHVNTFHSYAYSVYNRLIQSGAIPHKDFWVGDRDELHKRRVRQAVIEVQRSTGDTTLNQDEAETAISLWKASMIPPERAGHRFNPLYEQVYRIYEHLRTEANGATYDDMLTDVVQVLSSNPSLRESLIPNVAFLIVDEYQDVNYVQQRLMELVSGGKCDIIVVGDDDQTIYEWRGARPEYIRKFPEVFNDRPCRDYTLTRSFRFGPIIAQCAHNVIHHNKERHPKKVVAHQIGADSHIKVTAPPDGTRSSGIDEFVTLIIAKIQETEDPQKVIVLGRTWAQLLNIQSAFLRHEIPYHVIGQVPFTDLYETQRMLDYLTLCVRFHDTMDNSLTRALQQVLNFPRRYISKTFIDDIPRMVAGATVQQAVTILIQEAEKQSQRQRLYTMYEVLEYLNRQMKGSRPILAHDAVQLLADRFEFINYFRDFHGEGESSETRVVWLAAFIALAEQANMDVPSFIKYVKRLDPRRGMPENECVPITTIFQTKGLEYDYVFIPDCIDGFMPVRGVDINPCYDKEGIVKEPELSAWNESERRLFYVGITRARKGVYILAVSETMSRSVQARLSSAPSPYIAEMYHEATTAFINTLQAIAAEQTSDSQEILRHYDKYGDIPPLTQMLLEHYLPELGLEGMVNAVRKKVETLIKTPPRQQQPAQTSKTGRWWESKRFT